MGEEHQRLSSNGSHALSFGSLLRLRKIVDAENDVTQGALLDCMRGVGRREPVEFAFFFLPPVLSLTLYFKGENLHFANYNSTIGKTLFI